MIGTRIDDLVDEWSGVIVFRTSFAQILKINVNVYRALFFHDGNKFGNPRCIGDGVDKLGFVKLVDFSLY